jgi:hypothetical protein
MIILLILNVLSVFFCIYLAKSKGASTRFWGIMGLIFGPLAIPFVFFSKPKETSINTSN